MDRLEREIDLLNPELLTYILEACSFVGIFDLGRRRGCEPKPVRFF